MLEIDGLSDKLRSDPMAKFQPFGLMLPAVYVGNVWLTLTADAIQKIADRITPAIKGLFDMQLSGSYHELITFPTFLLIPVHDPSTGETFWMTPTSTITTSYMPYGPVYYKVEGSQVSLSLSSVGALNWQVRGKYVSNYFVFGPEHFKQFYVTQTGETFERQVDDDKTAKMLADSFYSAGTKVGTAEWKKVFAGGAGKVSLDSKLWWDSFPGTIFIGFTIALDGKPMSQGNSNAEEAGDPDAESGDGEVPYSIAPEGGEFVPDDKIDVRGLFVSEISEDESIVARLGFSNYVFKKGDTVSGAILKKVSSSSSQELESNSFYVIGGIEGYSNNKRANLQVYRCKVQ